MLAGVRAAQPGLVEELIPTQLNVSDVHKVLQHLLREKVPIRNLQGVIEALLDGVKISKDISNLVEIVRQRLAVAICNALSNDKRVLHVMTLPPELEGQLMRSFSGGDGERSAMTDPRVNEMLVQKLAQSAERMMKNNLVPVVLCSVELRRYVRALSERTIPHLRVLSVAEVPVQFDLKAFASIGLN
jgi:flagellar biosynthesis protein FlhA